MPGISATSISSASAPIGIEPQPSQHTSHATSASRGANTSPIAQPTRPRMPDEQGAAAVHGVGPWKLRLGIDRRLRPLERADVGGDRPAVGRRHAVRVAVHRAVAVGDHVDEQLVRRIHQPRFVEARRLGEAALDDHSVGVAAEPMAFGAEDVETLAAALGPAPASSAAFRRGHCRGPARARRCPAAGSAAPCRYGTRSSAHIRRACSGHSSSGSDGSPASSSVEMTGALLIAAPAPRSTRRGFRGSVRVLSASNFGSFASM